MVNLVQHNMQFTKRKKHRMAGFELWRGFDSKWHRRDPWATKCGVQWTVAQWSHLTY